MRQRVSSSDTPPFEKRKRSKLPPSLESERYRRLAGPDRLDRQRRAASLAA
jgi:hypothetical protein